MLKNELKFAYYRGLSFDLNRRFVFKYLKLQTKGTLNGQNATRPYQRGKTYL